MKETTTTATTATEKALATREAISRLPLPARKPRPATTTAPEAPATTTAPEAPATPEAGETGKDFPRLPFETQFTIISACLTNSAKRIEEKTGLEVMPIRFSEDEELTQESFLLCLARAENEKFNNDPLPLFVSRCTSSALNKVIYHGGKVAITEREIEKYYGHGTKTDTLFPRDDSPVDTVIAQKEQKTFPAPESGIMREDMRNRILDGIRPAVQETAEKLLAGIECGYTINESAKLAGISAKRAMEVYQMILNATAVILVEDGEENRLLKLCSSDERMLKNRDSRRVNAYHHAIVSKAYQSGKEKAEAEAEVKPLSYMDRIAYMARNQAGMKKLFTPRPATTTATPSTIDYEIVNGIPVYAYREMLLSLASK